MHRRKRREAVLPLVAACVLVVACSSTTGTASGPASSTPGSAPGSSAPGSAPPGSTVGPPPAALGHVFVINLENKNYDETWRPDGKAPYLANDLTAQGQHLTEYYGTAHHSLGNYLAQISGQGPNTDIQVGCVVYRDFVATGTAPPGQAVGSGCVFPAEVKTIANQLADAGRTWKGYMEDQAQGPADQPRTCRHPDLGAVDGTQLARPGDQYAARHNPFVYFHAIIDTPACAANVVDLEELRADLARAETTPNLAYITPNLCNDGHDHPCVDGRPGGLESADAWLREWVPRILASPAMRDGLLVITFDEAEDDDASACCGEGAGPNAAQPGISGPGGGRVGAVVISPWVVPGTRNATPYNHYALLCSMEDLFGLPKLGYAGAEGLRCFGSDVYANRPAAGAPTGSTP